ncbi:MULTISPECIES: 1-acyl-sn-glycerol-3-phosphate acyltransferase [unclassified Oceanispirochaeta]|uniref:1-acyl-sn-glycerol-3-phosphate acyltransferase n=1 Tax=unclassified Oceanispirochaeta TaxID=2635722 RepID=UPI000E09AFE7|nr:MULTISPECIES: 1-acyl-sn-glycerol-3-phosphate acyltransferase [unclassified Oceanispirochaeta]MBF9014205.1 1-acyl-sn-glycerol-3-phosphate acyltransferase [Oceanispirochaeta sp. M2]NPD70695.1 1-acyl-sn-glycerol-3-phosphate acyltransferase [Oceanispirochaeta sp. M1]RDG34455.1 1-acyl-sn-glycerol-3-phosphate acyltransferase [Oceanispirochaeta sp. M1]
MNISIDQFQKMVSFLQSNLKGDFEARPDNVYMEGVKINRDTIGDLVEKLMKPGSAIRGSENLKQLSEYSLKGKSCLLLLEHYSNFDYPALFRLIEKTEGLGPEVAERLLPIQGMKLSASGGLTAAFTNSYTTIVIYPSRSIDSETDPEKLAEIKKVSLPINHAAMREMTHRKYHSNIVVVFPAGTRYRPWDPESKKGVREIHSYLKAFDYVSFVSINGNLLIPNRENNMEKDTLHEDIILFSVSEPVRGKDFRKEKIAETPAGRDPKQYVVDQVMAVLERNNLKTEEYRKTLL